MRTKARQKMRDIIATNGAIVEKSTVQTRLSARELLDTYLNAFASDSRSINTQDGYKYAIVAYERYNGNFEPLSYAGAKRMMGEMVAEGKSNETINQYIGRLSKILSWAVAMDIEKKNFLDGEVFPRMKVVEKVHTNVSDEMDFDEILESATDLRDRAILTLLGATGLRKSELVNLNIGDVQVQSREYQLLVSNAKNGKQRWAIVPSDYANEMTNYLNTIDLSDESKPLFTSKQRSARLYVKSVDGIIKRYTKFSPHKFRHNLVEVLYQSGANIGDIADVIGDTIGVCERVYKGIDLKRQSSTSNMLKRKKQ